MQKEFKLKPIVGFIIIGLMMGSNTGCGTLTGLPSHGGGKRFSEEQRLVSASIRSTLKDIDVSALRGQKVVIMFDIISDEGGGTLTGGRFNILAGLTSGYLVSPVTSSTSQFQVFNLAEVGSNYASTATGSSSNSSGTNNIVNNMNGSSTQNSTGTNNISSSNTSTDTANSSGTTNGVTNIGASTNTQSATSAGKSTTDPYTTTTTAGGSTITNTTNPVTTTVNNSAATTNISNSGSTTTLNNPSMTTTINNPAVSTTTTTGSVTTNQNTLANQSTQTTQANQSTQVTGGSTGTQTTNPTTSTSETGQVVTTSTNSGNTTTNATPTVVNNQTGTSSSTVQNSASTNTNSGSSTNTSASAGTSNGTQNGTSTQNTTGSNKQDSTGKETTQGTQTGQSTADTNGKTSGSKETLTPAPVSTQSQTKGHQKSASVTLQYQGMGDYQNIGIPKSDATLLTGLVRNYLLLNGIQPTPFEDPTATAILYVTVDIFGITRSRFDIYAFNRESVKAETSMEMMAFDRSGKLIMAPRNANHEAKYDENYLFWTGPFLTTEQVRKGKGLLVDFSDVDGKKKTYPSDITRKTLKNNAQ